jgi:hypothetical protein
MVAAGAAARECLDELLARVGIVFAGREPRLQAGKYVRALTAEVPRKNGWQIAEWAGDASPDKTQRLLNHHRTRLRRKLQCRHDQVSKYGCRTSRMPRPIGSASRGTATIFSAVWPESASGLLVPSANDHSTHTDTVPVLARAEPFVGACGGLPRGLRIRELGLALATTDAPAV